MRKMFLAAVALAISVSATAAEAQVVYLGTNSYATLTGTRTLAECPQTGTNLTIADCHPTDSPFSTFAVLDGHFDIADLFAGSVLHGTGTLPLAGSFSATFDLRYAGADPDGYAIFEAFNIFATGGDSSGSGVNNPCASCGWYTVNLTGNPTRLFPMSQYPILAPVPEPATWVMILLGFGGIGIALRRRKLLLQIA